MTYGADRTVQGTKKVSRGNFPRLTFSLIPSLSERQCFDRIYVSCEASNPHDLPKVPLILTSGLELYQDAQYAAVQRQVVVLGVAPLHVGVEAVVGGAASHDDAGPICGKVRDDLVLVLPENVLVGGAEHSVCLLRGLLRWDAA